MDETLKSILREERHRREKEKNRSRRERSDRNKKNDSSSEDEKSTPRSEHRKDKSSHSRRHEHKPRRKNENVTEPQTQETANAQDGTANAQETADAQDGTADAQEANTQDMHTQTDNSFMFVYEDKDGKLFTNLEKIKKSEGDKINIFPVYFSNGHDNLISEEVTWDGEKLVPNEENVESSWITVIQDSNNEIFEFNLEDVVVYNNNLYHCEEDLMHYLENYGPDVLKVE